MAAKKATKRKAKCSTTRKKAAARTSVSRAKKGTRRTKGGRPPFEPTEEQRRNVEVMAGIGLRHEELCLLVINPHTEKPISGDTLRRHFADELARAIPKIKAQVGHSIVKRALDHAHPQGATCAIFFAKTRMGWKEQQVIEVETKSGVLVAPGAVSVDDWIDAAQRRTATKAEPGTEND